MKGQRSNIASTQSSSLHEVRGICCDSNRIETSHDAMVVKSTMTSSRARVRKKRNKVLEDQTTISDLLPTDLLMDILKLLPAKTLVRFLCVSKLWSSIIRRKDFKKLFLTESSNRPHRLFFISPQDEDKDKDCVLFSLETDDSGEALIAAYHKTHLPYPYTYDAAHVRDMICFRADFTYEDLVVYNNSTRRSITLPKLDSQSFVVTHFLSYDPIDDVYKVLCMTRLKNNFNDAGEFVLAVLYWCEPPYYVYYYDPKRNSLRKVPITGLRWPFPTYLFTSQVESLMFL
ncbi:putative F-box protein At5g44220 [Capsella rubella]|uniref:putative F-box protein At5g44220 n=1 Tax=Capsella rubella TaxID=81985 RepID=UPI000CD4C3B8|nr:putative F-box protein At5g44220 [Capsella rubella]